MARTTGPSQGKLFVTRRMSVQHFSLRNFAALIHYTVSTQPLRVPINQWAMASAVRQLLCATFAAASPVVKLNSSLLPVSSASGISVGGKCRLPDKLGESYDHRWKYVVLVAKSSQEKDGIVAADDDGDGVSLGTMKLPLDTDIQRFEALLFQWANSLCQGAYLPLPVPLKVDKIQGGARLSFITIEEGKTEVLAYIDCLVFPSTAGSGPVFRAIRNGPLKDQPPPGEPRIMRSLLQALRTSVEIARI